MKSLVGNTCAALLMLAFGLPGFAVPASAEDPPQFILQWGELGTGPGQFWTPSGIALDDSGNVYVHSNGRVQKFRSNGDFMAQWSSYGPCCNAFSGVGNIAFGSDGNLYVSNINTVVKISRNGEFITQWNMPIVGTEENPIHTWGIATDPSGNVYVSDFKYHYVAKFTSGGNLIGQLGSLGSDTSQFNSPMGLACDAAGNLYVADQGNQRIQKFNADGHFIAQWFQISLLLLPQAVSWRDGSLYVAGGSAVQKYTDGGAFLTEWGGFGPGQGLFGAIVWGVSANSEGEVYVCDSFNNLIQKFGNGGSTEVEPSGQTSTLQLAPPSPNPSRGPTTLRFSLPEESDAVLAIYDLAGRQVAEWQLASLPAGPHQVEWTGEAVNPGVMFARLTAGRATATQKLLRLR